MQWQSDFLEKKHFFRRFGPFWTYLANFKKIWPKFAEIGRKNFFSKKSLCHCTKYPKTYNLAKNEYIWLKTAFPVFCTVLNFTKFWQTVVLGGNPILFDLPCYTLFIIKRQPIGIERSLSPFWKLETWWNRMVSI